MARRVVLHNTGMNSKKYGSFERYLVRVAQVCRERGYDTVMQYESRPASDEYVRDLERTGTRIVVASSRGRVVPAMAACARLVVQTRPAVINNHFASRHWDAVVVTVGRMAGATTLVNTVHSDPGYRSASRSRFVYDRFDHVLPVSNAVRASLEAGGVNPARLRTEYLGLFGERGRTAALRQEVRGKLGLPEDAVVIGCIGFAAEVKGVDLLLQAFKDVVESHANAYLLVVGVEQTPSALTRLSEDLGIAERVVWAGIVDHGWRLLNAVDVYVQPSRSEGLPFTLMEAMAMRLPIVCTNVSGNVEAIVDGTSGVVVRPDPDALAVGIKGLLDHPERWSVLADAAWERYREYFDGETSVDRLVTEVYRIPRLN